MPEGEYKYQLSKPQSANPLYFKVEAGGIITSDLKKNKGKEVNGIIQNGKVLFKMQFASDKSMEIAFDGVLQSDQKIEGHYKKNNIIPSLDSLSQTGKLHIQCTEANIVHDQALGDIAPVLQISYKGTNHQSQAGSGNNPNFGEA